MIRRGSVRALRAALVLLGLTLGALLWLEQRMQAEATAAALAAPADAAIVLGAGVEGDGRLAYDSRRRVAGAVALLAEGRVRALIFTGGLGGNHPTVPAAVLMRNHAEALGAPAAALLVEPRAVSTFENLRFSLALAQDRGFARLVLVSDPYHLPRARALAGFLGRPDVALVAVGGSETVWWPHRAATLVREALAWWLNLAKVAGWEALGLAGMTPERRAELIR